MSVKERPSWKIDSLIFPAILHARTASLEPQAIVMSGIRARARKAPLKILPYKVEVTAQPEGSTEGEGTYNIGIKWSSRSRMERGEVTITRNTLRKREPARRSEVAWVSDRTLADTLQDIADALPESHMVADRLHLKVAGSLYAFFEWGYNNVRDPMHLDRSRLLQALLDTFRPGTPLPGRTPGIYRCQFRLESGETRSGMPEVYVYKAIQDEYDPSTFTIIL